MPVAKSAARSKPRKLPTNQHRLNGHAVALPVADQPVEPTPSKELGDCMTEDCHRPAETRGLCNCCYATALRYVRRKLVTWKRLEELGLVQASKTGVRQLGPMSLAIEKGMGRNPAST